MLSVTRPVSEISSTMSRFGLSNPYLSSGLAGSVGSKFSELSAHQRAALYWPGIQGLISNPAVWRDRFVLSSEYNNLVNTPHSISVIPTVGGKTAYTLA